MSSHDKEPVPRLDRAVVWSLGLYLMSFPLMLVFLVLSAWVAPVIGVVPGSGSKGDRALNAVYVGGVVVAFLVAAVVGLTGWRRRGQRAGLAVAGLSVLTAAAFVALPSVLGG